MQTNNIDNLLTERDELESYLDQYGDDLPNFEYEILVNLLQNYDLTINELVGE